MKRCKPEQRALSTYEGSVAVLFVLSSLLCASICQPSTPKEPRSHLLDDTMQLMAETTLRKFATAVISAPRNDSGTSLRITLAGLFASGVQDVHLVWAVYDESGRPPHHVRALLRNFTALGSRIHTHMVGPELWLWKGEGRCNPEAAVLCASTAVLQHIAAAETCSKVCVGLPSSAALHVTVFEAVCIGLPSSAALHITVFEAVHTAPCQPPQLCAGFAGPAPDCMQGETPYSLPASPVVRTRAGLHNTVGSSDSCCLSACQVPPPPRCLLQGKAVLPGLLGTRGRLDSCSLS